MEKMTMFYDSTSDVLYLSVGEPRKAVSQEIGDDIVMRLDPDSGEVMGVTILNLSARFGSLDRPHELPIEMILRKAS